MLLAMSDAVIVAIVSAFAGLLGAMLSALGVYFSFKMRMAEIQSKLTYEHSQKESYKSIAKDSMGIVETLSNEKLMNEGKPTLVAMASVVPEHKSPVTREAQESADLQTERAKLVAARLILGLPPREPSEPETEAQRSVRLLAEGKGADPDTAAVLGNKLSAAVAKDLKKDIAKIPEKTADEIESRQAPGEK